MAGEFPINPPFSFLPITCPKFCENSSSAFPMLAVNVAHARWNHIALHANRHDQSCDAAKVEVQALQPFVGKDGFRA
jgi:hypothetical protein